MKKTIMTLAVAFLATGLFAQENVLATKNGTPILPTAGSVALGIDATPFFRYVGGIFSNNDATVPSFEYTSLYGKYFLDNKTAIRGRVVLDFGSYTTTTLVQDVTPGAAVDAKVEDKEKQSGSDIYLAVGLEKRIGKTRLQGFYGAEVGFGITSGKTKYEYGNKITANYPVSRITENKQGAGFEIGANLFVGTEYFVAPSIAIGGELGWGLVFVSQGNGEITTEAWDSANSNVKTTTTKGSVSNSFFGFNTNLYGALNLTFYF